LESLSLLGPGVKQPGAMIKQMKFHRDEKREDGLNDRRRDKYD